MYLHPAVLLSQDDLEVREKNYSFQKKPFSWSQLAQWEYNKENWYNKYCLGIIEPPNNQMLFGNKIGKKIENDPIFLPKIPRFSVFEKKLIGKIDDIELIGFIDSFCPNTYSFHEYKTSSNKTRWTQESAQNHGQLLFYKLLIWLNYEVPPENVTSFLHYIPVREEGDFKMAISKEPIQSFEVKHTCDELLNFGNYIRKTYKTMSEYADKLSTEPV